jgi:hypothetical protein
MSEADKHMLGIEGLTPVPWEDFGETAAKGEMQSKAIEQRRFEEGSVPPGLDSDVIIGVAVVVWSATVPRITRLLFRRGLLHTYLTDYQRARVWNWW